MIIRTTQAMIPITIMAVVTWCSDACIRGMAGACGRSRFAGNTNGDEILGRARVSTRNGATHPINRLLEESKLDTAKIELLNTAFNRALLPLHFAIRNDSVCEMVARKALRSPMGAEATVKQLSL
jgi:hypothetical protein